MSDQHFPQTPNPADLAAFLVSLAGWLEGMHAFMAATRSEWTHTSAGGHLMAQRLCKQTLTLKREALARSRQVAAEGV